MSQLETPWKICHMHQIAIEIIICLPKKKKMQWFLVTFLARQKNGRECFYITTVN